MSAPDDNPPSWKEPASLFAIMLLGLAGLTAAASVVPVLNDWLLLLAALVFIGLPYVWLTRRGEDLNRFGIDLQSIPLRHIGLGLLATILIFPIFAVGFHTWETEIEDKQAHFHSDHLRQWSTDLDAPRIVDASTPGLQIRAHNQHLYLHWVPPSSVESTTLKSTLDRPWRWTTTQSLSTTALDANTDDGLASSWSLNLSSSRSGHASLALPLDVDPALSAPQTLSLDLSSLDASTPIFIGGTAVEPEEDSLLQWKRDHWWLLLWGLTHLLLIALPEEYFYRGYLQTRLGDLFHGPNSDLESPPTLLGFSYANWATSACFALGHFLIPIGGSFNPGRLAVFFPSLIFGRLKRHTGSIIAPTVFHAGANMMILVLSPHYFS